METVRKPLQGTLNIIRFNWHLYFLAIIGLMGLSTAAYFTDGIDRTIFIVAAAVTFLSLFVSLAVSFYVYDLSGFYDLKWLDEILIKESGKAANINAGFDETTELLKKKFPLIEIFALDFYDPEKHTEISIERARKAYPRSEEIRRITTTNISLENNSLDTIFLIFAAHEIRNTDERKAFFAELSRILKTDGKVVVTEHLRDAANFLAYNIGSFHFHTRSVWNETFASANLEVEREIKISSFVTTFVLKRNGISS